MESKFTKGKWEIETMGRSVTCGTSKIANCSSYNELCGGDYLPRDEEEANTLLISKAPEMLEMLKEFIDSCCGEQQCEEELIKGLGNQIHNSVLKAKQLIKEATEL